MSELEHIEPVKTGITGCGGITPSVLRGAHGLAELEIVAVQDLDGEAAKRTALEFDIPRYYTQFSNLLADDIELVVINTPNDCHKPQALEAFAAGKHCIVQKPLARNVSEGEDMIAAARNAGRLLGVVMLERADPIYRQMRSMAASGCFGTITAIRAALAHVNHLRRPPDSDNWRCSPERIGGGSFIQLAIHHIDIAQFILDQDITEVAALSTSTIMLDRFPKDETTGAVVRFRDGAIGLFLSSFTATADSIDFHGTDGMMGRDDEGIRWLSAELFSGELWDSGRAAEFHELGMPYLATRIAELMSRYEPHRLFAHAIRGKLPVETPGEVGLQALKVVDAVQRSATEKRAISIP
jgi:1,5-anhydro-D-fructose reductase (1,5-anhydro-D-mannitol-forming)